MNRCPQCGRFAADGFDGEGAYTPGLPCANCGYREEAPVEPEPKEEPRGVVLRLVPPGQGGASIEQQRAICRKILLETLTRVENGEVDELVLATVNSKQSPNPYTLRWQMTDPVRIIGLLGVMHVRFSAAPFVTMT